MTTARDVAEWMLSQLEIKPNLYQETASRLIRQQFGDDFVYRNENGNWAISAKVLKQFRDLSAGAVVWERGDKSWRKLHPNEKYKGRQVD